MSTARSIVVGASVVLGVGVFGVVFVLPTKIGPPSQGAPSYSLQGSGGQVGEESDLPIKTADLAHMQKRLASPPGPAAMVHIGANKEEAERLLSESLRRQARLENGGVKIWGKATLDTSYPEALGALAKANAKFDNREYQSAIRDFGTTITLLDQLAANQDERFRRAMAAGSKSLQKDDIQDSVEKYEVALALRPGDQKAKAGMERAKKLPQVLAGMTEGKQYEIARDLDNALRAYLAVKALDPAYARASQSANRVGVLIRERDFQNAISGALSALDGNRVDDAARALDLADRIRPKAPETSEIRLRIRAARQLVSLKTLRTSASSFERKEQWEEAKKAYETALSIDQSAKFAVDGKGRAEDFVQLYDQIEFYLKQPDRLDSPEPLAHARLVLAAADAVTDAGSRLRINRDRLRQHMFKADIARSVLLLSDELTEVTVYRVGRFEAFREKRISLSPGAYTAVGARVGFRDVRVEFHVSREEAETVVVVKCAERI